MIYGLYKNARNASWQCLIDYKIDKLPINVVGIAKQANIKIIKNIDVGELQPSESGASILDGDGKQWYIIYDSENTIQRCRFTIAHELGHIFLGHELKKGYHARTFNIDKPNVEYEADVFASRLLSPACVLWGLNLHSAEEIAKVCNISLSSAKIRAERMKILYERNKFLTSQLERQVYNNFEKFINNNR